MRWLVTVTGRITILAWIAVPVLVLLPLAGSASASTHSVAGGGCSTAYGQKAGGDGWAATEGLTRTFGDGTASTHNCFRISVNKHTSLQDHERITVSWSGAHPTAGRSLNPYGESGLPQEYPVMLLECRGVDPKDGAVPSSQEQVSPDTCWTNTYFQRSASAEPGEGVWQLDADAPASDQDHLSGIDPSKVPSSCSIGSSFDYHITPFVAADKTFYAGCSSASMPPEATVNSVSIPNEVAAFTSPDGKGSFPFEVRTNEENQSLGCSSKVPCTLEAIPIDGINCAAGDTSQECNGTGQLPVGQVNPGSAPEDAVAPAFWWSASNWNRRVPVPLTFAPPTTVCSVSSGKPVPFYGSELLSQAALQWTPAYCLNSKRFNWQDNIMPDDAAFSLMTHGTAAAAEVSTRGADDADIGYAPTAATGWGIAFDIDKPGNDGQQMTLKLNARLLAKLLTESYPGTIPTEENHPGFSSNPLSMNLDPEFQKLNPGLDTSHWNEAASVLMAISTSSAVMEEVTSYIKADPDAMAFIDGKADPWGMKVNPFYKNIKLPVSTWPLLDTWVNKTTNNPCLSQAQTAYMPLMADPVSSLRLISTALLYNWPYVGTGCTGTGTQNDPFQLGRVATEGVGNRFILGLVTLADAQRYGLTVASLQAAPGHYVTPDDASIGAALKLGKHASGLKPFRFSQASVRKSTTAYPGSMVVYTAAKTTGLSKATAKQVSQFITISSTQGQVPGRGNGELPAGYLPISKTGATAPYYAQARAVAADVAEQKAISSTGTGTAGTPAGAVAGTGTPAGSGAPSASTSPSATPSGSPAATASGPTVTTAALSSATAGGTLPILLGVGLLCGIVTTAGRLWLRFKGVK